MLIPNACQVLTPNGWISLLSLAPEMTILVYPYYDVYNTYDLAFSRLDLLERKAYLFDAPIPQEVCVARAVGSNFGVPINPFANIAVTLTPQDINKVQASTFMATPFELVNYPDICPVVMLRRHRFASYTKYPQEHHLFAEYNNKLTQAVRIFRDLWRGKAFSKIDIQIHEIMEVELARASFDPLFFYKWRRNPRWASKVMKVRENYFRVYRHSMSNKVYIKLFKMLSLVLGVPLYYDKSNIYLQYWGLPVDLTPCPIANFADILEAHMELKILQRAGGIKETYGKISNTKNIIRGHYVTQFDSVEKLPQDFLFRALIRQDYDKLPVKHYLLSEYDFNMIAVQPFIKLNTCITQNKKPFHWTELQTDKTCLVPVMYPNGIILFHMS